MEIFEKCLVENCENNAHSKSRGEKGYCSRHYAQINQNGKILKRTRFDPNEIIDCGNYYEICLYSGCGEQKEVARAEIDKEDLEKVKSYKWHLMVVNTGGKYVISGKDRLLLQHLIMGKPPIGYLIDHQDTNPLNNRKYNLRFATPSQNGMNKKNVKGITWDKNRKKWMSHIKINGKYIYLGRFDDKQIAIKIRKEAEQKYFGEFAYKEPTNAEIKNN